MDKMEHMDNQTEAKKINTGKIGFILSLVTLAISLLLFILPVLLIFVFLFLPLLLLCLLFLLSFVFSIHGLIKKRSPKLAKTGLIIAFLIPIVFLIQLITLTPAGSMPYPLSIYKFRKACPKADFWLNFNKEHIEEVKSQNVFFVLGSIGTVHFTSSPNAYTVEQVIQHAEANGWKHHVTMPASKFQAFINASDDDLPIEEVIFRYEITSIRPFVFLMEQNDSVMIFETGNYLGIPSVAILSEKRDALRVYYNNGARPDPARDFSLPQSLHEFDENNNEDIHENQRHRTGR
ncbi:MAG: hypothetical protein OEV87_05540 [Phycisphaerae bacterium]|nr:hypothetical protein [Phycisphaerae bacterium]